MIQTLTTFRCTRCQSQNIVKNGHDPKGKQQFRCKDCQRGGVLNPFLRYTEAEKERIVNAYYERPSMRGIERVFGVTRQTLAVWLKKSRAHSRNQTDPHPRTPRRPVGIG